jgi:hypothetical protein
MCAFMRAHVPVMNSTDPKFSQSDKWMWSKSYKLQNIHYTNVIQNSLYTADNFIINNISKVKIQKKKKKKKECVFNYFLNAD